MRNYCVNGVLFIGFPVRKKKQYGVGMPEVFRWLVNAKQYKVFERREQVKFSATASYWPCHKKFYIDHAKNQHNSTSGRLLTVHAAVAA